MDNQFPLALPVGTNVNGYVVNKVIGQGGFGITYLAFDTQTSKAVALKEYLPPSVALRNEAGTVTPYSVSGENDFAQGKESFLKEAQNLGRFKHEAIVQVLGYFEANGTAYTVMEFVKGDTLAHRIKQLKAEGKTMSEEEIMTWFNSVMDGLESVHKGEFMHRDIKPDNIMINPETGKGCLIDFGAARHDAGGKTKSLSVVLTPGFAPIEQYSNAGKGQGTWTDVYALGATVWCAMTGEAPTDAPGRSTAMIYNEPDPILCDREKLINAGYSAELVDTVIKMLAMNSTERLKTIADVKESFAVNIKDNLNQSEKKLDKSENTVNATVTAKKKERNQDSVSQDEQYRTVNSSATFQAGIKKPGEERQKKIFENVKKDANYDTARKKMRFLWVVLACVVVVFIAVKIFSRNDPATSSYSSSYLDQSSQDTSSGGTSVTFSNNKPSKTASDENSSKTAVVSTPSKQPSEPTADELYHQGRKYYYGREGEKKNYKRAFEAFKKAADKGQIEAMNFLGCMYADGEYVKQNKKIAVEWYKKAALAGNSDAQYNLAQYYENGEVVKRSLAEAIRWYKKAAAQGDEDAKRALKGLNNAKVDKVIANSKPSKMSSNDKTSKASPRHSSSALGLQTKDFSVLGLQSNEKHAAGEFYHNETNGRNSSSTNAPTAETPYEQYRLGLMYETGQFGSINIPEAVRWFKKAAAQGNEEAKLALERIERQERLRKKHNMNH